MKPLAYCCPVLELVIKRDARFGLRFGTMVKLESGRSHQQLIYEFPRGKDKKAEFANSTWAPVTHCPFCGTKQTEQRKASKAVPA